MDLYDLLDTLLETDDKFSNKLSHVLNRNNITEILKTRKYTENNDFYIALISCHDINLYTVIKDNIQLFILHFLKKIINSPPIQEYILELLYNNPAIMSDKIVRFWTYVADARYIPEYMHMYKYYINEVNTILVKPVITNSFMDIDYINYIDENITRTELINKLNTKDTLLSCTTRLETNMFNLSEETARYYYNNEYIFNVANIKYNIKNIWNYKNIFVIPPYKDHQFF